MGALLQGLPGSGMIPVKTLTLGNIFSVISVQDLLRLQNQDTGLNRLLTQTSLATPTLYSPNELNALTSYFKVL